MRCVWARMTFSPNEQRKSRRGRQNLRAKRPSPKLRKIYRESSPTCSIEHCAVDVWAQVPKVMRGNGSSAKPRSPHRIDGLRSVFHNGRTQALSCLLAELPSNLAVPVVIVQHMPPIFTKHLAEPTFEVAPLRVREAFTGAPLLPGEAWIAPGDFHLTVSKNGNQVLLGTHQGPPENSCRPAVDVLFRSVSQVYGHLRSHASSRVWGKMDCKVRSGFTMQGVPSLHKTKPLASVGYAARDVCAGQVLADLILPLDKIGKKIIFRVHSTTAHAIASHYWLEHFNTLS